MRGKIEFEFEFPSLDGESVTREQINEWIKYELVGGGIDMKNPLYEFELVADYMTLDWQQIEE